MTKLQISAELMERWTEDALASRDASDIIEDAMFGVLYGDESVDGRIEALLHLMHARRRASISMDVFASLMKTEVRIAFKFPEPMHS